MKCPRCKAICTNIIHESDYFITYQCVEDLTQWLIDKRPKPDHYQWLCPGCGTVHDLPLHFGDMVGTYASTN